jgi:hypothetical protein
VNPCAERALLRVRVAGAASLRAASRARLRTACEQSPGNVVVIDSTKLEGPPGNPTVTSVSSGCTLALEENAKLEAVRVRLEFAGPLVIRSAFETELKLLESYFRGTSVRIDLPADGSTLETGLTTLHATTGALDVTLRASVGMIAAAL